MTPERAKQLSLILQAFSDGKEIQERSIDYPTHGWVRWDQGLYTCMEYRIKPEPKKVKVYLVRAPDGFIAPVIHPNPSWTVIGEHEFVLPEET